MHTPNAQSRILAFSITLALATGSMSLSANVIEEVTVTAQKREENLQTVPVSVTAFTGEQIRELGFQSEVQVISQSPNVTYSDFGTAPSIRIRGIGADTFSETIESSAAVYRDQVYRPTMASNNAQLYDVERVEVLRGPQGTLYGRNTNGGLIHFHSRRPTDELEGYADLQFGRFNQIIFEGAVSGGFTEGVRGRLSFKSNNDDGFQTNVGTGGGDDFGATDIQAARGQLEFDLGESAVLRLIASASKQRNTSLIYGFRGMVKDDGFSLCDSDEVLAGDCYAAQPYGLLRVEKDTAREGYSELDDLHNNLDSWDATAILDWEISDTVTLVSVTGYEDLERSYLEDTDASDGGLFFGFDEDFNPIFAQAESLFELDVKTFSQELRLQGDQDSLSWVAGIYYFDDDKSDVLNSAPEFGFHTLADVSTKAWAGFGQIDFMVTDTVTLTGGLRYSDDDRKAKVATPFAPFVIPGGVEYAEFKTGDGNWTYKLGVNWQTSDDLMVYFNHSTGVKSGEFNINFILSADQAAPVGEEKVRSYELGAKWDFMDGRGRLNSAVFYNDYRDYQGTAYDASNGAIGASFQNIGDVDIWGAEFELFMTPTDRLELMLGLGLLDSEISAPGYSVSLGPAVPPEFAGGTPYDVDGNELTQAPGVTFNGMVRYTIPTDSAGDFTGQVDFSWQDEAFLDFANDPYNVQDSYGLVNLRLLWTSNSGRFYGQAFVENVGDEFYVSEAFTPEFFDRQGLIFGKPRTWGVKFGINF